MNGRTLSQIPRKWGKSYRQLIPPALWSWIAYSAKWQQNGQQSLTLSTGFPGELTARPHSLGDNGRPPFSKTPVSLSFLTCWSQGTWPSRQTGWRKQRPSHAACIWKELKCCGAWNCTVISRLQDASPYRAHTPNLPHFFFFFFWLSLQIRRSRLLQRASFNWRTRCAV